MAAHAFMEKQRVRATLGWMQVRRLEIRWLWYGALVGAVVLAGIGWTWSRVERRSSELVSITETFQYEPSRICVRRANGDTECGVFIAASNDASPLGLEVGQQLRVHREETNVDGTQLLLLYSLHIGD